MDRRPNILWISFEDTSPRLGCYGDTVAQTPVIDSLAAGGRLYQNAFSTAPVCAPSRCSIITAMYAAAIGAQHMRTGQNNPEAPRNIPSYECVPPPFVKLIPEYLRAAGYFCTNNEKTDYQFASPFTAWDERGRDAHWRHRDPDQPFFAVFNPTGTHESHQWAVRGEPRTDPSTVTLPPYLPDTPECRRALARQYDNLAESDRYAGELLSQLEEDGLAENTVVMFWSDHGEGLPRSKRWPYDTGIHVPLIVRWPGRIAPGEISDQLVSLIDLGPTVLSLAGIPLPRHFQGKPFLGPEAVVRDHVFATRDRYDEFYDCIRAVRSRRFKYLRNLFPEQPRALWNDYLHRHPIQQELFRRKREGTLTPLQDEIFFAPSRPPEELYDLEADPWEMNNLAAGPEWKGELTALRAVCDDWQSEVGDLYREPEEQLSERFWPGGHQPVTASPYIIGLDEENHGLSPFTGDAATLQASCLVQLYSPTHGASMAYSLDPPGEDVEGAEGVESAEEPRWKLYAGPFALPPGTHTLRARCIRIGYAPSATRSITLHVGTGKPPGS